VFGKAIPSITTIFRIDLPLFLWRKGKGRKNAIGKIKKPGAHLAPSWNAAG